ncbi:PemK toxin [Oleiphilus messinensis]|uniref:PemK toxin n=1 Tax=Oleiphilus messinensis TaxID=141451 RepID=A0A1Y0I8D5_9GAMM|nr:hypothetical protein [Oleiphilus messinensis]ARU56721.1 PemK toxin [Oleiphilus messinensis]
MAKIPEIGHVIKYSYLWWNEHRKGKVEGLKERPCSVLLNRKDENGRTVLFVLPITHTPPEDPESGIEIPAATKKRLGLDEDRSWVITTEFNKFSWPGYDIRKLDNGLYSYGVLPEKLITEIIKSVQNNARVNNSSIVDRDD